MTSTRAASWPLVSVLAGNMLLDALEVSVVVPVLPTVSGSFGVTPWQAQWVMSGFALGFGALLPAGHWITHRWGRRRVYLAALVIFAAASVAGGVTSGFGLLVATRVVKGACAALTAPAGLSVITTVIADGPRQRRAVSVYALVGAAGFTVGILLSGVLTPVGWRWVFLFPAPASLLLLVFAARWIPADPPREGEWRRRWALPRNGIFLRSAFGAAILNGTYLSVLLLTTFDLQARYGWSALGAAAGLLPACLPAAVLVPLAGRLVERLGTARLIVAGALAPALGYAYQLLPLGGASYPTRVLPTLILVGAGFVLAFGALNMQATASVPATDRGRAVPLYQCGVQFGAAVMLILTEAVRDGTSAGHAAWVVIVIVGTAGVLVAVSGLRPTAVPAEPSGGTRS